MAEIDAEQTAHRVREEIARRRLSRQKLADLAKISLSTLEKALAGKRPFTLATVIRIEEALGCSLRPVQDNPNGETGPFYLGSYSRPSVQWVEGRYLTVRPSFNGTKELFTYLIDIRWNAEHSRMEFAESKRLDANFHQSGQVSIPNLSGHIYLVTNDNGQYRLMVLGRPNIEGTMFGILTTLQVGSGSQLVPVSCPLALARYEKLDNPPIGQIAEGSPQHAEYRALIDSATAEDFARFYT